MDTIEHTTADTPQAMIDEICTLVERRDGVIAKVQAAKHLSDILHDDLENAFAPRRKGEDGDEVIQIYKFNEPQINRIKWLAYDLWELTRDLAEMLDEIQDLSAHASHLFPETV